MNPSPWERKYVYTLCLKKVHFFHFCDYSVRCWPILIIFGNIAAEKICNLMTLFLNIQFVYEYYAILYAYNAAEDIN